MGVLRVVLLGYEAGIKSELRLPEFYTTVVHNTAQYQHMPHVMVYFLFYDLSEKPQTENIHCSE